MMKNPSRKVSKAFDLIVVVRIRIHVSNWEALAACRSSTPRAMRIILSQVIQLLHFGESEAAVV